MHIHVYIYIFLSAASQPLSLLVSSGANPLSVNVSWQEPDGIYPIEVFPRGLTYQLTLRSLYQLNNTQTVITNSTFDILSLTTDMVYILSIEAALLEPDYGPKSVILHVTGNCIDTYCEFKWGLITLLDSRRLPSFSK